MRKEAIQECPKAKPLLPQPVSKLDMAFGGNMDQLLPPWKEIPDEFKHSSNEWCREVSRIFYRGGSIEHWKTKPGIDRSQAIAHFKAVLGSWEPKHEHKEAGCAYLLSQWFTLEKP